MPVCIDGDVMAVEIREHVVAAARFSEHAAGGIHGAWIVWFRLIQLFTRDQAIPSTVPGGRLAGGSDDHEIDSF
jgi:hypothetical protein